MTKPLPALFLILSFLLIRYGLDSHIQSFGKYASYFFETFFVGLVFLLYKIRPNFQIQFNTKLNLQLIGSIPLGALAYFGAVELDVIIPFDLKNYNAIILILVVGPILEEVLFRGALWTLLDILCKRSQAVILITAALFSFAHFYAYFFVSSTIHAFILYQTIYTFFLGLWWGTVYFRTRSLATVLGLHLTFNFGFFLGSFLV